jgi:regulator of sigma E protease
VGEVTAGSRAEQSGFRSGDEILAIDGQATPSWESVIYSLLSRSLDEPSLAIRVRDEKGDERDLSMATEGFQSLSEDGMILQNLGLSPARITLPPVFGEIIPGEPADQAGVLPGDRILSVDGIKMESWNQWVDYVRERPGQPLLMLVERDSLPLEISLTTATKTDGDKTYGRVGAGVDVPEGVLERYQSVVRYGPVEALSRSVEKTWDLSVLMLRMLGKMVTGEVSVKNLSGPLSIADIAGKSASHGLDYFIKFLAGVSVSLAVLNLLPIPVLDGGHLFFFLIEAVKGRPLSERFMEQGQKIGLLILLAIMSLAFYVDLNRFFG